MNNQHSTTVRKPAISHPTENNKQFVEIFLLYLEEEVNQDDWMKFSTRSEIKDLIQLLPKYGDYLFQDLVNKVAIFFDLPVKLLLQEFSGYRKGQELQIY